MDGSTQQSDDGTVDRSATAERVSIEDASGSLLPPLTDTEFALAIDARLWVSPSGEMRNNTENYRAVDESLKDLAAARELLQDLLEHLIRLQSWRTFPQLAAPILEALLFVQDIVGQIAVLGPDDVKASR